MAIITCYSVVERSENEYISIFPDEKKHLSRIHPSWEEGFAYMRDECGVKDIIHVILNDK